jgi:hypothetical protein
MSKYFNKLAVNFPVMPLQIALRRQPGLFGKYNYRCEGSESPHRDSTDIWVRYNAIENVLNSEQQLNSTHPANGHHRPVWYPAYYQLPDIRPLVFNLMSLVEGEELGTILLIKIPPGKCVYTHTDGGWSAGYYEKYFIPVQAYAGTSFNFPDGSIIPTIGDVYWFNNSVPHNVTNNSCEDMVCMVVTIRSDKVEGAE